VRASARWCSTRSTSGPIARRRMNPTHDGMMRPVGRVMA
jgi:hypothetical protein